MSINCGGKLSQGSRHDSQSHANTNSRYESEAQDDTSSEVEEEEEKEDETGPDESSGEEEDDSGPDEVHGEEEEEEEHHVGTSITRGRKRPKPAPTAPFKPGNKIDPLLTGAGAPEISEILLSFSTHTAYNVYQ